MIFRNQTDNMTVIENFITNNRTVGVLFLDASSGTNSPVQTALNSRFNNNSISGNWYGEVVDRQSGGSLPAPGTTNRKDFRFNWLGTTSPVITTSNSAEPGYASLIPVAYGGTATAPGGQPDLAGPASANILYMPLLTSGTDTNVETTPGRGTNGFQSAMAMTTVNPAMYNGWLFYNDENDTIDNSLGSFVVGPGTPPLGLGSAQISVTGTQRRNLATYQFAGTSLASINNLRYSTYNPSAGNGGSANRSGYLHFNVDFDGSDTWQRRLVYVPSDNGTVNQNSWQEWDAINNGNAIWRYSGGAFPGGAATTKTWNQILADYPGVRMRVTDSFLGIRVGEPYADGYTENIDAFKFGINNGSVVFDFEPSRPSVTINQASGQADPTSSSPINFTVVFSEPVTGFTSSDVTVGGTAGATTVMVTGSGATYNVAVSGMTGSGTVTASVVDNAANAVSNSAPSMASTSTDNSVTYFTCNNVSIPTGMTVLPNTQFLVPINVDDTSGRGILAFDFTLNYNSAVVSLIDVETTGTLSNGWVITTNSSTPGTLVVSGFNISPLSGAGTLLNVRFSSIGAIGTSSTLNLPSFAFNEGVPCVMTSNGNVSIISGTISGLITYANALTTTPVPNVTLNAAGSIPVSGSTNGSGMYSLSGFGTGAYTVTPSKTGQANGISNSDATAVAQHVVGISTLNSTQQIAADVSGNGSITSLDASYIAQYVALFPNISSTGTWRFIPPNRAYANVQTNYSNEDYSAILMGEVTGNWNPALPLTSESLQQGKLDGKKKVEKKVTQPEQVVTVSAPSPKYVDPGENFAVDLTASNTTGENIFGYEFNLLYDAAVISPQMTPCDNAGTISGGSGRSVVCNPMTPGVASCCSL